MGHDEGPGHCEIRYEDCRVPAANLLGEQGAGFAIAQDRLGPGRIHHCMRAIGTAERALEMMCRRANEREAFGGPLAEKQFVQEAIAASRMEIDQARLLTLYAAWKMDTEGKRAARQAISAIKVVAANMVMDVLDRAIQVHGSLGMTDDTPLAALWRFSRMLRLADGPDEVHKMVLARRELNRWAKRAEAEASRRARPRSTPRGRSERAALATSVPITSAAPKVAVAPSPVLQLKDRHERERVARRRRRLEEAAVGAELDPARRSLRRSRRRAGRRRPTSSRVVSSVGLAASSEDVCADDRRGVVQVGWKLTSTAPITLSSLTGFLGVGGVGEGVERRFAAFELHGRRCRASRGRSASTAAWLRRGLVAGHRSVGDLSRRRPRRS